MALSIVALADGMPADCAASSRRSLPRRVSCAARSGRSAGVIGDRRAPPDRAIVERDRDRLGCDGPLARRGANAGIGRGVLARSPGRDGRGASRSAASLPGRPTFDGVNDDLGGDLQAQAGGVEHHVEVVRVVRVGAVHGAIELGTAAIEIPSGPAGRADRNPHPLGQPLCADLRAGR